MATGKKKSSKQRSGPKPETIKIDGPWENAVWKALKKERPKDGWPKPESKKKGEKQ